MEFNRGQFEVLAVLPGKSQSIAWPEKTSFLMNPDPAIRKKLKRVAIFAGVAAALWLVVGSAHGPIQQLSRSMDAKRERPAMEAAMNAGNRTAGTWLAMHFWKDYPGLLQTEAEAGEPTAMFLMGRALMIDDHSSKWFKLDRALTAQQVHAQGLQLVRKAAAAGNEEALKFALDHGGV
ncbi:hypothetical protein [Paraburkholderia sp. J94]|uniref:hypothetical protein n=1 Tax=Paraburkholderia sp. J94 TaxID=2805441 RepID=UPI002AB252B0|nr:hypothetical protein [Paraburkholderia sp. J94]